MHSGGIPPELEEGMKHTLAEVRKSGAEITNAYYDEAAFGNYNLRFNLNGMPMGVTQDRGHWFAEIYYESKESDQNMTKRLQLQKKYPSDAFSSDLEISKTVAALLEDVQK